MRQNLVVAPTEKKDIDLELTPNREEDMLPIGMHKHIGHQLERLEVGRQEKVQPQDIVQVHSMLTSCQGTQKAQNIDDKEIFRYCR